MIESKEVVITMMSPGDEVLVPGNGRSHYKWSVFIRCYSNVQSVGDIHIGIQRLTLQRSGPENPLQRHNLTTNIFPPYEINICTDSSHVMTANFVPPIQDPIDTCTEHLGTWWLWVKLLKNNIFAANL